MYVFMISSKVQQQKVVEHQVYGTPLLIDILVCTNKAIFLFFNLHKEAQFYNLIYNLQFVQLGLTCRKDQGWKQWRCSH